MEQPGFRIEKDGLPDIPAMMFTTLHALRTLGGSAHLSELDDKVIEIADLSEEEQSYTMPNDARLKVNYYLAWARTFLKRGGALENSVRAVWALTDKGEGIASVDACKNIYDAVYAEERERARKKRMAKKATEQRANETLQDKVQVDDTDSDVRDWKTNLLAVLGTVAPDAFERLAQRLLREAGFTKVEVRGKSGDGGIDGLGVLRVNLVSFQVYFQCKRWQGSVPSKEIRDFRGALQGRADKGLFITTGKFTSQATEEATRDGAIAIDLIDGDRLCDLKKQYGLGVETEMVESVRIIEPWFSDL